MSPGLVELSQRKPSGSATATVMKLASWSMDATLGARRDFLEGPRVAVGVGEVGVLDPAHVLYVADLDPPVLEAGPDRCDAVHAEVESLHSRGVRVTHAHPDRDGARGARRGELDDPHAVA